MAFSIKTLKPGSYIYFENTEPNPRSFYIIQDGQVGLSGKFFTIGIQPEKVLRKGDFFGVETAMTGHKRMESAVTSAPTTLIEVPHDQFRVLITKSTPLAMKIIRSFSLKLREFDATITNISAQQFKIEEDPSHLYDLGVFWFKSNRFDHAAYAFQKFIEYCPNDKNVAQAKLYLQKMNKPFVAPKLIKKELTRYFKKDQIIFCENEPGDELYIIKKGSVKISKLISGKETILALLKEGDIFGEMALLDNRPRSATAIAAEDCEMAAINRQNFDRLVIEQPIMAERLITLLSERIWTAYRQLSNLTITDPIGRLLDMLLIQVEKEKVPIKPKATYNFRISGNDLLKMVGMDPVKDQQYIVELIKKKYLELDQGLISCKNLEELDKEVTYFRKRSEKRAKKQTV
ncbi:MAG: cyclic nucleotide-binding domain-containing protein [Leptospiraceae bacterium]|nr:cyclic nucleotide-binding domain-containing protein [Leptospiraceae bacterium]MDW7975464.1 cyclic nucleotide-binding domain-containing protein [Leptospiraceae bacterium]